MKKLNAIIEKISNKTDFVFVSVGANDGIFVDEIYQSNLLIPEWTSYFIEPIKERFDLLVNNYESKYPNNKFNYENYALYYENGESCLITSKNDDSRGLCSFVRQKTEESVSFLVDTRTFQFFVEKNQIKKIDFLKIDCEGLDYEIILQCLELKIFPKLILFEDISLGLNDKKIRGKTELIEFLSLYPEYEIIDDYPEFQYEENNKLIINKNFINNDI
jgi:FkbM family methyltransferase